MAQTNKSIDMVISNLEMWFAKAPKLPKGLTDFFVTIAPWISLIGGVALVVLSVLALIGSPFVAVAGAGLAASLLLAAVVALVEGVIYLLSFNPLRKRQIKGWNLLLLGEALSVVHSIVNFDILSAILTFLIGFYVLFQMKSYYK